MNPIELELMWANLRGVVTEQAKAMQRIAFSPVVREAGDLAYALFDARGRIVAQADTGTPGHINCLAFTGRYLAEKYAGDLAPGDVLITNDPWLGAGHFFDIAIVAPIFRDGRLLGYVGSTNHHTDIGGSGVGVGGGDVHEEGLWIPPAKLYEGGRPNAMLHDIIAHNVRTPDLIAGDLAAQVASARAGAEAVIELCRRYGLDDIEDLSDQIVTRSEAAMRDAIATCPSGTWSAQTRFDVNGTMDIVLCAAVTIDAQAGEVLVDFDGSSPEVGQGINVVLNYTHAYSTFTVRSCLTPDLPNNAGSMAPIKVTAPEGCILNCRYPAPVAARHVVGMCVPMPILKALHGVIPDRVLAEGPGAVWSAQVTGRRPDGSPYTSSQFSFSGGMGARATKPGPDATCYPTGIGATPIEVLEMETPIVFHRRELRPGSGGAGRTRGGDGQVIEFGMRTGLPWHLNAAPTGLRQPPAGLDGGACGATGRFMRNGVDWQTVGKVRMDADDMVRMETPGAGGFGPPAPAMHDNRDPTGERRMAAPIKVQNWKDLPSTLLLNGRMERVGFRSDEALLTFNRIEPGMKRWRPHAHPFDQIVITAAGTQILEIENETLECPAGSIVRVPANARHTGWPGGDEQVLNIDVFAPPRPDYLFLVEHQSEFPQPAQGHASYHQDPQAEAFSGAAMRDTSDVLFLWDDLPKQSLFDGKMQRSAFRSDHALVTFNWIEPGIERPEPHSHPFDQVVLVLEGAMVLEVDGREYECGPGAITRIPPDAMHTGWVVGTERVLNMDVFAPARADYLHLTTYQKDYA